VAEATGDRGAARRAFSRAGAAQGWAAIDCGCGPIGALAVLAEMAGPAGRVVGVDVSELAVTRARSVAAALQLDNIEVVAGDIHHLDPATLGGPLARTSRTSRARPAPRASKLSGQTASSLSPNQS
jgi:SAM-dependent methyltransferase